MGGSSSSLSYQFQVSQNLISTIIPELCWVIYQALRQHYLKAPTTAEEWKTVARDYFSPSGITHLVLVH